MKRDLIILLLITGGLFTGIYLWLAYEPDTDEKPEETDSSLFGEEITERITTSFEQQFTFIENEHTRAFEEALRDRFAHHVEDKGEFSKIRIIESDQVNAFTTVGDGIYLFKGLLKELDDPEMVTAVVAHEWGHIHHNHVEDRLKRDIGTSLLMSIITGGNQGMIVELSRTMMELSFSRSQELEADDFASDILKETDIHPQKLSQAFLRMKRLSGVNTPPAFLTTHPALEDRIQRILEFDVPEDFEERELDVNWEELIDSL